MIEEALKNAVTSELQHTYYFMKDFTFTVSVSGTTRSTAVVTVNANTNPIWSCTLNPTNLEQITTHIIDGFVPVYGNVFIKKGAVFTLTPPTADKDGKVVFKGIIGTDLSSSEFTLTLFSWPLSSSL